MKKFLAILLALTLVFTMFAACGKKAETNPGDTNNGGATTNDDQATYAIILKTLSNSFWSNMQKGIEAEAERLGIKVDIFAAQSEEDTEGQLKILESCITKGYTAIGVAPLSPVNLIPGIVKANEKGIYVMNIDEKVDLAQLKAAGGSIIGFATTDNVAVGEKGANYIIDKLTDGGKVAIIEGKAGNASGEARKEGATKAFTANTKFELVGSQPADWDRQKALDVATSFINKNPDLKAIYCCNDTMALGALQAVINANKLGQIIIVGTDGADEALASIEQGQLDATVAQDPGQIGATSLVQMVNAVKNKITIDPNVEPETIPVESKVIAKD